MAKKMKRHWKTLRAARLSEGLDFTELTDRYQALGIPYPDPDTMCKGFCEGTGVFPVFMFVPRIKREANMAFPELETDPAIIKLWRAAEMEKPSDDGWHFVKCPECKGIGLREVYKVTYGGGKMKTFSGKDEAERFASRHRGAKITFIPIKDSKQESFINPAAGNHDHPHDQNGTHPHWFPADADSGPGVLVSGGHSHEDANIGGLHRHRKGDPLEGGHLNVGNGAHDHLLAKGLDSYIEFVVAAHHPVHKWLPGHKRTLLRHIRPGRPDVSFRVASETDWTEHTLWGMHSSGVADTEQHGAVFLNDETRLVEKLYEFEDGTIRPASAADFEAEKKWFAENTPKEVNERLLEAKVVPGKAHEPITLEINESMIPKSMRWWMPGLRRAQKLERINAAFNHLIDKKFIKARKGASPEVKR